MAAEARPRRARPGPESPPPVNDAARAVDELRHVGVPPLVSPQVGAQPGEPRPQPGGSDYLHP